MAQKVLTAPLAIIKVNGVAIGKMRNVRCTENFRRGRVAGIGELTPQELPALEWSGTLTCQFFLIDLKQTTNGSIPYIDGIHSPTLADTQKWIDGVLLQENGVDVDIYKKVSDGTVDAQTGLLNRGADDLIGTVQGCFIDRSGFDISEGQIAGRDMDFQYMSPILFNP